MTQDSFTQDNQANNKRIAKNTILLYIRMLFIMAVQLFTSRVVLNTLGVVDYGLYNVVGGIVTMFAFLNGAMVTSTQRYITFELGKGNLQRLKEVFTTCVQIHLIISIVIIILGETVGLWFLYEKMVIPEERFTAAMWVYQLSILTMVVQVMSVPYNSSIIAHEKMSAFAFISVAEVVLKLLAVYMLLLGDLDKLILYAILIASIQLLIRFIYTHYCNKHFIETCLIKVCDKTLIIEMGKFAVWNLWGNLAATLSGTGINLLLNVFFGPVVNAARAIALQVETAIAQFSTNFLMAVNPQITKLYAQKNVETMNHLLFRASKFTFFLLFALSLPVIVETNYILKVWLKTVPDYTVNFLHLLLIIAIIDSMARPFMTAAAATGNVKVYQSVVGGIMLGTVPIAYVVLKLGGNPTSVYAVHMLVSIIAFFARLYIVKSMISLPVIRYIREVLIRCVIVCLLAIIIPFYIKTVFEENLLNVVILCIISFLCVLISSYMFGLTNQERLYVNNKIVTYIHKKNSIK